MVEEPRPQKFLTLAVGRRIDQGQAGARGTQDAQESAHLFSIRRAAREIRCLAGPKREEWLDRSSLREGSLLQVGENDVIGPGPCRPVDRRYPDRTPGRSGWIDGNLGHDRFHFLHEVRPGYQLVSPFQTVQDKGVIVKGIPERVEGCRAGRVQPQIPGNLAKLSDLV